jgi:N-methylhydantoinase A
MLMSDLRRDYFVTELMDADDHAALASLLERTRERAIADFVRGNVPAEKVSITSFIRARYQNQEFAVEVPLPAGVPDAAMMARLIADFHDAYEREYTYRLDAGVEIIGLHLVAASEVGKLEILKLPRTGATIEQAIKGRRDVDYATEGIHLATIYDGTRLEPGMAFAGPAVIEDPGTTVVIQPGNKASIDDYGNIHIAIRD